MRWQPPSPGFCYLVLVVAGCAAFFWHVNRKAWYDRPGRADRISGEARYLYRLAQRSEGAARLRWLNQALPLFFELGEDETALEIAGQVSAAGAEPDFGDAHELVPDRVWVTGLTADRATDGARPALFAARNDTGRPRRLVARWRCGEPEAAARYRVGAGPWQPLDFARSAEGSSATLEVDLAPQPAPVLLRVVADGAPIRLDGVEVEP